MESEQEEEEYEYYIAHDTIGASHVIRVPKGRPPQVRCAGCDD